MITGMPVVCFDTSAHNRMLKDGARSEPLIAGLKSGFFVRLAGLSIEEIFANPDPAERAALLACAGRLQQGANDCLYPPNEILKLLIGDHKKEPGNFDWKAVSVRAREYESAISRQSVIADDELSAEQKIVFRRLGKEFEKLFSDLRPEIEDIFTRNAEAPPVSFREVLPRIQSDGGLVWGIGKRLYDVAAETDASEATIKEFINCCPPFRAVVYATLLKWYDRSIRNRQIGEKFRAQRNDLFMAVYLPYCDKFITAEIYGEQERCLREIAEAANVNTEIQSYDNFYRGLSIGT